MTQTELMHYGKKGMRWGVRKAPDIDTQTLKTTGKIINDANGAVRGVSTINNSIAKARTESVKRKTGNKKPKGLNQMTDKELQQRVQRLNMEQQYSNLTRKPQQVNLGQERLRTALEVGGGVLTTVGSVVSIALAIKNLSGN